MPERHGGSLQGGQRVIAGELNKLSDSLQFLLVWNESGNNLLAFIRQRENLITQKHIGPASFLLRNWPARCMSGGAGNPSRLS